MHMGGKISACVVMKNSDNAEVAKDMAMQGRFDEPELCFPQPHAGRRC